MIWKSFEAAAQFLATPSCPLLAPPSSAGRAARHRTGRELCGFCAAILGLEAFRFASFLRCQQGSFFYTKKRENTWLAVHHRYVWSIFTVFFRILQREFRMPKVDELLSRPTITPEEARQILRLSKNGVYEALRRGEIGSVRIGRKILIPTAPLRALLSLTPHSDTRDLTRISVIEAVKDGGTRRDFDLVRDLQWLGKKITSMRR
jgi:excisionase family DNA binding protein